MLNPGSPIWSNRNYKTFADNGYKRNIVVYRAIQLVTRAGSRIPIELYDGDKELDNHPMLRLLSRPNPYQSTQKLLELMLGYYCISGNIYLEGTNGSLDGDSPNGPPLELFAQRPDRIVIEPSKLGVPMAFVYNYGGALPKRWEVDPFTGEGAMLHIKSFNPTDDYYGLSPIEAAGYSVDTHTEASAWNKSLLQNGASPSGALIYKPQGMIGPKLTKEQRENLQNQLDERMTGSGNAGRPLIMDGGMEWVQMGINPKDMEFANSKNMSAREIAWAFGVPGMLLGIPGDNTYANMEEARASFYEETIIPVMSDVLSAMANWLGPAFGIRDPRLVINEDRIPALFGRRKALWDLAESNKFTTTNEKRMMCGYEKIEGEPMADQVLIPAGLVPLSDVGAALLGAQAAAEDEEAEPLGKPVDEDKKPKPSKKPVPEDEEDDEE